MPGSRSAKEICREFGEDDLACRVAKNREARQRQSGIEEELKPRPTPPTTPPAAKEEPGFLDTIKGRRERIEAEIKKAE